MIGLDLLVPEQPTQKVYGMVIGIVTNNRDPNNWGRVKVKFPWLADGVESNWARMVSPMAGGDRGLFILPEVDDEVLVRTEAATKVWAVVDITYQKDSKIKS